MVDMGRKVLILVRNLSDDERSLVEKMLNGYAEPYFIDDGVDEVAAEAEAAVVSTARHPRVREALRKAVKLRFLQTLAAGVDNIPFQDLPRNVIVASNAGANAEEVAEFTVALILTSLKNIVILDRGMRRGDWWGPTPKLLRGSKVVILGYGHIGREIAKRIQPFKPYIVGVKRRPKPDEYADEVVSIRDLEKHLPTTDILVVTLPLTKETRGFVDRRILDKLKEGALVVNVGRGPVIDEEALFEALSRRKLYAALDVWWVYPSRRGEPTFQNKPFHLLDNVVMTPHVAGSWPGFRRKLLEHALENLRRYLAGEEPRNIVDLEEYL